MEVTPVPVSILPIILVLAPVSACPLMLASIAAGAPLSTLCGNDPLALISAIGDPRVSSLAVIYPIQLTTAAEASKAILADALKNNQRYLVCPVSPLPCLDSVAAASPASLVGGDLGHPRPTSVGPYWSGPSESPITAPLNRPQFSSQPATVTGIHTQMGPPKPRSSN